MANRDNDAINRRVANATEKGSGLVVARALNPTTIPRKAAASLYTFSSPFNPAAIFIETDLNFSWVSFTRDCERFRTEFTGCFFFFLPSDGSSLGIQTEAIPRASAVARDSTSTTLLRS